MHEVDLPKPLGADLEVEFRRNDELRRYEALVATDAGTDVAAFAEFVLVRPSRIIFTHTVSEKAYAGKGIATRLVAWALGDARDRGERIVPRCPFVVSYLLDHREFDDAIEGR